MIKAQELEQALKDLVALDAQSISRRLALLLAELANSSRTYEDTQHLLPDSALPALLVALAGKEVSLRESVVSFGEGSQLGDVTIGEVIKGHSFKLSFNFHQAANNSPAEAVNYAVDRSDLGYQASESPGKADEEFAEQITDFMARLSKKADRLTKEQYRVIQYLRGERRARISGCAGSGKTLVAIEKALRLDEAGISTLFLCHSPLLAEYVAGMTQGSAIRVLSFGSWVAELTGQTSTVTGSWSKYEEPVDEVLGKAFDAAARPDCCYDAIIVDEGQDFREEWWAVVEAALMPPSLGILYIFHDDQQSLLPHRATYPILRPVIDLSRNCRNAGNVYSLMRRLIPQSPEPEEELLEDGHTLLLPYSFGMERELIERTVRTYCAGMDSKDIVILLSGAHTLTNSPLSGNRIILSEPLNWQEAVRIEFREIVANSAPGVYSISAEKSEALFQELEGLSDGVIPSMEDVALVQRVASYFRIGPGRRTVGNPVPTSGPYPAVKWSIHKNRLRLHYSPYSPNKVRQKLASLVFFQAPSWAAGLPGTNTAIIQPYYLAAQDEPIIRMYDVADFKGLEANVVILIRVGQSPALRQQLYVGVSRARYMLIGLIDKNAAALLPANDRL